MTATIRYVKNTIDGPGATIIDTSAGQDYQLVAFDCITTVGIEEEENANILNYTGSGTIKEIYGLRAKVIATGEIIPMGAVDQNTHTLVTLDATSRIVNVSIPAAGVPIPAGSVISFLAVIGNY